LSFTDEQIKELEDMGRDWYRDQQADPPQNRNRVKARRGRGSVGVA
jgi:hypothetical protein